MRYSIRRAITVLALAALAGGIPAFSHGGVLRAVPAAAGTTQICSGLMTGPINGNLLVTGLCDLVGVTLTGSIAMTPGSEVVISLSSIGGNISGQNVQVQVLASTVRGNINVTASTPDRVSPKNPPRNSIDINNSLITGTVYGSFTGGFICDSNIHGSIKFVVAELTIGDPGDENCPGNTIGGGIILSDFGGEIESNTIGGSVSLTEGLVDLSSNMIAGSATCSGVTPINDLDSAPNTTKGSNTC